MVVAYFFAVDFLAVDAAPSIENVSEHERNDQAGIEHCCERELA